MVKCKCIYLIGVVFLNLWLLPQTCTDTFEDSLLNYDHSFGVVCGFKLYNFKLLYVFVYYCRISLVGVQRNFDPYVDCSFLSVFSVSFNQIVSTYSLWWFGLSLCWLTLLVIPHLGVTHGVLYCSLPLNPREGLRRGFSPCRRLML